MERYIPLSPLVAEIESLRRTSFTNFDEGVNATVQTLLETLDTFEVNEVYLDFEKELYKTFGQVKDFTLGMCIAKHFFELGVQQSKNYNNNEEIKIGETEIYLEDDGGEPPYDGIQWLDLSCMEYEIPKDKFKDGDNIEIIIRKAQKGEVV